MSRLAYIGGIVLELALVAGVFVLDYFSRAKLGMNRWLGYQNRKWEENLPVPAIEAIVLAIVAALRWRNADGRCADAHDLPAHPVRAGCPCRAAPSNVHREGKAMISIVATAYNEMAVIADFFVQLHAFSGDAEVIVVDGLSDDGTYELLCELRRRGEGWFTLARSEKCRGAALNEETRCWKRAGKWRLPVSILHVSAQRPDSMGSGLCLSETVQALGEMGHAHIPAAHFERRMAELLELISSRA